MRYIIIIIIIIIIILCYLNYVEEFTTIYTDTASESIGKYGITCQQCDYSSLNAEKGNYLHCDKYEGISVQVCPAETYQDQTNQKTCKRCNLPTLLCGPEQYIDPCGGEKGFTCKDWDDGVLENLCGLMAKVDEEKSDRDCIWCKYNHGIWNTGFWKKYPGSYYCYHTDA